MCKVCCPIELNSYKLFVLAWHFPNEGKKMEWPKMNEERMFVFANPNGPKSARSSRSWGSSNWGT